MLGTLACMTTPTDAARRTYVLVDGENIDATLGNSLLGRRPNSEERPRWERLTEYVTNTWGNPVKSLFFLNVSNGHLPMPFVQALCALDYKPIPLSGVAGEKVVDMGISRTLEAILRRDADVLLASHDGDFLPEVEKLVADGNRRVGLVGFREFFNSGFSHLTASGLEYVDLEYDVDAFQVQLPRVKTIPITEFDPEVYL